MALRDLQNDPCQICLVGADGPTHCGAFDTTFMACLPNMVVMAPSCETELMHKVATAATIDDRPSCFRYSRGSGIGSVLPPNNKGIPLKNIVHFDLKSHNFLVNMRDPRRPVCKIGDLGLSKIKQKTLVSGGVRGNIPWMASKLLSCRRMHED